MALVVGAIGLGAARIGYQYPLHDDPLHLASGIFHFAFAAFLVFEASMRLPDWSERWTTILAASALLTTMSVVILAVGGRDALWWSLAAIFSGMLAGILLRTGYVWLREDSP